MRPWRVPPNKRLGRKKTCFGCGAKGHIKRHGPPERRETGRKGGRVWREREQEEPEAWKKPMEMVEKAKRQAKETSQMKRGGEESPSGSKLKDAGTNTGLSTRP